MVESWNFGELKPNNIMSLIEQKNSFIISVYEYVLTHEKTVTEPGCLKFKSGVSNMWPIIHLIQSFFIIIIIYLVFERSTRVDIELVIR
jgi:hypothetical protein